MTVGRRWAVGRRWIAGGAVGARVSLAFILGGLGCSSGGGQAPTDAAVSPQAIDGSLATDSGGSTGGTTGAAGTCGAPAPTLDLCAQLPTGTIAACSLGAGGEPSPTGYLEIAEADGSKTYVCATSWSDGGSGGYFFGAPDQFMSDPMSCCGGPATPVAAPTAPQPAFGYLGALHAPKDIKPQEMQQPGAGSVRTDPFAVVVRDPSGAAASSAALATWLSWAGDGTAHPAPDGTGAYYFPHKLLINYAILETAGALPIVVIGPEVSLAADGSSPMGHPTLGACAAGGGAPLVLMAGELAGTTLTNHSGRYGHDTSVTQAALDNAAKLFNCLGIQITATTYYPPTN